MSVQKLLEYINKYGDFKTVLVDIGKVYNTDVIDILDGITLLHTRFISEKGDIAQLINSIQLLTEYKCITIEYGDSKLSYACSELIGTYYRNYTLNIQKAIDYYDNVLIPKEVARQKNMTKYAFYDNIIDIFIITLIILGLHLLI
jgi:hypothetical protein